MLARFRAALGDLYGERIERVVLYGSRARGDYRADSDYDVAVFLDGFESRWAEMNRLADLRLDMLDKTGAFFQPLPYRAGTWADRTPLMHEVRREGVEL